MGRGWEALVGAAEEQLEGRAPLVPLQACPFGHFSEGYLSHQPAAFRPSCLQPLLVGFPGGPQSCGLQDGPALSPEGCVSEEPSCKRRGLQPPAWSPSTLGLL